MASQSELEIIIRAQDQASATLKKVEGSVGGLGEKAAAMGKAVAIAGAAAGAALLAFGVSAVKAAAAAEEEFAIYEKVMKQAAGATDEQVLAMKAQADTMGRLGGVSKEAITRIQQTTAEYFISTDAIKVLTPAITDYIAVQYGANASVEQARNIANGFGKAMQGQMDILKKAGFTYTEAQKKLLETGTEMERVAVISDILGQGYDGANLALSNTADGGMRRVTQGLKDIHENIGKFLMPLMGPLVESVSEITGKLVIWSEGLGSVNDMLGELKTKFTEAMNQFEEKTGLISQVREGFEKIWATIQEKLWPALQRLWEALEPLQPQLEALAAIAGGALVLALKVVLEVIIFLIDQTVQLLAVLAKWTAYIFEHSKPAIEFFTRALNKIGEAIQFVIDKFNVMRDAAISAFNAARNAATSIPGVGGVLNAVLPGRAVGGPVTSGQPYVVGERGPEVFVPRGSGTIIPNGGGTMQVTVLDGANITVRSEADIQAIVSQVTAGLARTLQGQRNGLATAL